MSKLISVGKIIDSTWDFYVKHFGMLMRVTLWLFIVTLVTLVWSIFGPVQMPDTEPTLQTIAVQATYGILITIVSAVIGFWIFLTLLQAIDAGQKSKTVDTKPLGRISWKMFPGYAIIIFFKFILTATPLLSIAPGVAILIYNTIGPQIPWLSAFGMLLTFITVAASFCVVIYISTLLQYAEYLFVFEGKRGVAALRGSRELVTGRFWATLWRIIVPKIVFLIPMVILQIILATAVSLFIPSLGGSNVEALIRISNISDSIVSTTVAVLTTSLFIIADYYVFQALRKTPK